MPTPPANPASRPGLLARLGAGLRSIGRRAVKFSPMQFGGGGGWTNSIPAGRWMSPGSFLWGALPGSPDFDYAAEAGQVWLNGAVGAGLSFISDNFFEPNLIVEVRQQDGRWEPDTSPEAQAVLDLLLDPNPDYDGEMLFASALLSWHVAGVGYFIKARAKAGRKLNLYYVPHWEMLPTWPEDGSQYISGYKHVIDGREYKIAKEDVIAIRRAIDPQQTRSSLPPLASVLREICADNYASVYTAATLRNFGVVGVLIQPDDTGTTIDDVSRRQIDDEWREKSTGENRGKPIVSSVRLKVDQLALSPEDLALDKMRSFPEERICAALKLDPIVLHLPSGTAKTYQNVAEARRAAYHDCLIPLQKTFARALTRQLLPDFFGTGGPARRLAWDYSKVEALGEDQDAKSKRVVGELVGGVIMRSEARAALGLESTENDEVYYLPRGAQLVTGDNLAVVTTPDETDEDGADDTGAADDDESLTNAPPADDAATEDEEDAVDRGAGNGAGKPAKALMAPAAKDAVSFPPANPRADGPSGDATITEADQHRFHDLTTPDERDQAGKLWDRYAPEHLRGFLSRAQADG